MAIDASKTGLCMKVFEAIQKRCPYFSDYLRPKSPPITSFFSTLFDEYCNLYFLPLTSRYPLWTDPLYTFGKWEIEQLKRVNP